MGVSPGHVFWGTPFSIWDFPGGPDSKEPACNEEDVGSIPGLGRPPWRREWLPSAVFLSGESHGQRSLAGYSPGGHKEVDMTEWLSLTYLFNILHQGMELMLALEGQT